MKNGKIFIQIASYRDPQLSHTIRDCIEKAKNPNKLVFSVAWQHSVDDEWDYDLYEFRGDPRVQLIDIDYRDAKGACWARYMLQQKYAGEEYTLQIDSHTRFTQNWDAELIKMYKGLQKKGSNKPLLTAYAPSFDPKNDPDGRINIPWKMNFDRFTPEGFVFTMPASIDNFKELDEPIHARFYSAHFAFTTGEFVNEVPHDPEFYFHGEENSIATRAFTWGYDLYHPHKVILWHEYTRNDKIKQWDDDPQWVSRNTASHKKCRQLFGMDGEVQATTFGKYGFGQVRTLDEYERYAGISFKNRGVQKYTTDNNLAPNPVIEDPQEYRDSFNTLFKHCIDLYAPNYIETDYDFWVVSFEEYDGTVVYRQDADANEVRNLINGSKSDNWIRLWREYTGRMPDKWVVWPHSVSKGWCDRVEGILNQTIS